MAETKTTASTTKKASTSSKATPAAKAAASKPAAAKAAKPATASASAARSTSAKKKGSDLTPEQRYRMICDAAYYRAERRGFVGGDPALDWVEAEAEIDLLLKNAG